MANLFSGIFRGIRNTFQFYEEIKTAAKSRTLSFKEPSTLDSFSSSLLMKREGILVLHHSREVAVRGDANFRNSMMLLWKSENKKENTIRTELS